jgi:hypothetical protein
VTVDDRDLAPKYPANAPGVFTASVNSRPTSMHPSAKDMDFVDHAFITKDFDGNPPDHGN